jgi:hypothetical protein
MNPHAERYCPTSMFDRLPNLSVPDGHLRPPFQHTLLRSAARCVLLFGGLILAASQAVYADTTWVAGAVSGTWTVEGSPYVIVDSSWVGTLDTLQVLAGVRAVLLRPTSQLVFQGTADFVGTLEDSVEIVVANANAGFGGYCFTSARSLSFEYCIFTGSGYHCAWATECQVLHSTFRYDRIGPGGLPGSAEHGDGHVVVRNSILQNFSCSNGNLEMEDVTCTDQISCNNTIVHLNHVQVGAETLADSSRGYISIGFVFHDYPVVLASVRTGTLDITHSLSLGDSAVVIDSCEIYDLLSLYNRGECHVTRSRISEFQANASLADVSRCIIGPECDVVGGAQVEFRRCTFAWRLPGYAYGPRRFINVDSQSHAVIDGCIFYSARPSMQIALPEAPISPPRYNLVHGMTSPWGNRNMGPGNISADPQFDPRSMCCALQYESPAIDGGNPQDEDEDGTRADIGAWAWDHRFDHYPIVANPDTVVIGWGERLNFIVRATDDGLVRLQLPPTLPGWLKLARTMDEHVSRVLFVGKVPYGSSSVTIPVVAIDNANQADSVVLTVAVRETSCLADTISGHLDRDHSPYVARTDVYVAEPDSLTLDPGVEVLFDSGPFPLALVVGGYLSGIGTDLDSVSFRSVDQGLWHGIVVDGNDAEFTVDHLSIDNTVAGIRVNSARRCKVLGSTIYASSGEGSGELLISTVSDTVQVANCCIVVSGGCGFSKCMIRMDSTVLSCDAASGHRTLGCSDLPWALMRDCRFTSTAGATMALVLRDSLHLTVERCLFVGGDDPYIIDFMDEAGPRELNLYNSTIVGSNGVLLRVTRLSSQDHVRVVNCLFDGGENAAIRVYAGFDSTNMQIAYSNFWNSSRSLLISDGQWVTFGELVAENRNGDSVDTYGNLFADPRVQDTIRWELSPESPCVDAGIDLGHPFSGASPDIGYFEYELVEHVRMVGQGHLPMDAILWPNPANGEITIRWTGQHSGWVQVAIWNVLGQSLWSARYDDQASNSLAFDLNALRISSGMYLCTLTTAYSMSSIPFLYVK